MNVAIIKYNAGNIFSVDYALKRIGVTPVITSDKETLLKADKVICLGMQLMCKYSEEGNTECLGIFDTDVKRFCPQRHIDKVPHMGWNTIENTVSPLFKGFDKDEYVYFVHSYYIPLNDFTAARTNNFYATQFHPEKSGKTGERILRNFLEL